MKYDVQLSLKDPFADHLCLLKFTNVRHNLMLSLTHVALKQGFYVVMHRHDENDSQADPGEEGGDILIKQTPKQPV